MKLNINTPSFWNVQNIKSKDELYRSNVYLHKNNIVLNWITGSNLKLLNIGIGNGYLERLIKTKKRQIDLYGIDIADQSINDIKNKVDGNFKVSNITKIPYEDKVFDYVVVLDVLEHLNKSELKIGLNEISRVIKRQGILIISVPINENSVDKMSNRHLTEFTKTRLVNLLKKNNFEIASIKELFAFNKFYFLKTIISNLFKINHPNLLIIKAIKL